MPTEDAALIEWLADNLQYRSLPRLIGRRVATSDRANLEADLRRALGTQIPKASSLISVDRIGPTLDVSFDVSSNWLTKKDRGGVALLETLGFVMSEAEADEFTHVAQLLGDNFEEAADLILLKEEIEAGHTYLRMLLVEEEDGRGYMIKDACFANAQSVWLYKHQTV